MIGTSIAMPQPFGCGKHCAKHGSEAVFGSEDDPSSALRTAWYRSGVRCGGRAQFRSGAMDAAQAEAEQRAASLQARMAAALGAPQAAVREPPHSLWA